MWRRVVPRRAGLRDLSRGVLPIRRARGRHLQLVVFGMVFAAALTALLLLQLPSDFDLEEGTPSPISLIAPDSVTYIDTIRTAAARDNAANDPETIVYSDDRDLPARQREELRNTLTAISSILSNPSLSERQRREQMQGQPSLPISDTLAATIQSLSPNEWQPIVTRTLGLYDRTLRQHRNVIDEQTLAEIKATELRADPNLGSDETSRDMIIYFVSAFLRVNRQVDEAATKQRQDEARQRVPEVTTSVIKGESIIRAGDLVTAEHLQKLNALGLTSPSLGWLQVIGRTLLAVLFALGLSVYLYLYHENLWKRPRRLIVLGLLILLAMLASKLLLPTDLGRGEALPLALFMILIAALFNGPLAAMVATLVALASGVLVLQDRPLNALSTSVVAFAASLAGIYAIRRHDRTTDFLRAGSWVAMVAVIAALAIRLTDLRLPLFTRGELVELLLFSALNGVISGLGALGAYNFLGRMAGIVTPLQLLELAHPNQPLLRRLMQEAPGTHHHSVVVSNLCENAAEAIGADSLLVRVGAYYHDVGKIIRPYFFTDNQHNRANVHESLDPRTSATLICDHVTEGVRLARQYGLPQQIVDFIPQHHGTSVIKYFYQQALQRDDTVSIDDYRYPGPKPQSKEAAILMLADGCEATVRSREQAGLLRPIRPEDEEQELDADARGRGQTIEEVVDQSVQDRMRSGELDESTLTLRDLNLIKQSFVKTLQGIYHPRVDYPRLVKPK